MRHSCGRCGSQYGCNGGLGSPCVCGHRDLLREDRRCNPCRLEDAARLVGQAPDFLNDGLPPAAAPPMYRFVHGLLDPFAPQPQVAPPPVEPRYIDWVGIPRAQRCKCNKCSRDAQAHGVAL